MKVESAYVGRTLDGKLFTEELATNIYHFRDGLVLSMDWGD